jgi:hypothetical protein
MYCFLTYPDRLARGCTHDFGCCPEPPWHIGVGLTTLAHNRLTGIESDAHDANRDIFYLIGKGHPQIPEGDVADAKSIVEIVTLNFRIRGTILGAKAAFLY